MKNRGGKNYEKKFKWKNAENRAFTNGKVTKNGREGAGKRGGGREQKQIRKEELGCSGLCMCTNRHDKCDHYVLKNVLIKIKLKNKLKSKVFTLKRLTEGYT